MQACLAASGSLDFIEFHAHTLLDSLSASLGIYSVHDLRRDTRLKLQVMALFSELLGIIAHFFDFTSSSSVPT